MVFIPIKWFPWLLFIVSSYTLFYQGAWSWDCVFALLLSLVWIYFVLKGKRNAKSDAPTTVSPQGTAQAAFSCPDCGAKLAADAKFCEGCGRSVVSQTNVAVGEVK